MRLPRRKFLLLAAGAAALPTLWRVACAQAYPTRPVRIVVTYPAGSTSDILARLLAQWLQDRLRQPFVIEIRPGAGGTVGTEAVVRATPDGYTLLLVAGAHTINTTLYEKLSFNFLRDIAPIGSISREGNVLVVNLSVPARTLPEFISYAKANPGKMNMASAGNGGPGHVAGELFKMMTGIDLVHIPYRGSPAALTDLLGGQVQVYFVTLSPAMEHIRNDTVRALAVTTAARSDALPELPTVGEFVPGYEASSVWGLAAPRSTPAVIIDKLNQELNAALADPRMKARIAGLGAMLLGGSSAEFGQLLADETEKWAKVIRFAGIKPD
jgi:tripartite-type tricarboxylate transporter receptor subunit TctC